MLAQEFIARHIESDRIIESLSVREYKKNNREMDKICRLFKMLEKDLEFAKVVYKELLSYDCAVTRINAAAECLSLRIYVEEALWVLAEIAKSPKKDMRCFNAEMTLRVWREQGYLKVYPEQEIVRREES